MKNLYYVIRRFRNGRSPSGFDSGLPNRFSTLAEAEANAETFAARVLPTNAYDRILVGSGSVRNGFPVGGGKLLVQYSIPNQSGKIERRALV